jgi:hypothetical protein
MNWPSQNDAQFGSLVKPGKLNPGGLSSRIPHWIYPLGFLMCPNIYGLDKPKGASAVATAESA